MRWRIVIGFCFISCLLLNGCADIKTVIESREQIQLDMARDQLKNANDRYNYVTGRTIVPPGITLPPPVCYDAANQCTGDCIWKQRYLDERYAYMAVLKSEMDVQIASLEREAKDAGYFDLSLKGVGIGAGIASAALIVASPANAAWVAGLTAVTTGALAFEDKATEVGISTTIAIQKENVLKGAAGEAFNQFGAPNSSFEYMCDRSRKGTDDEWKTAMDTLGSNIAKFEAAVRYTKLDVTVTSTPVSSFTLHVVSAGGGTVVSEPAGIKCPGTCDASFQKALLSL